MLLRRHSYDEPWRCPGWNGGGYRSPHWDTQPVDWIEELLGPFYKFHRRRTHWWQSRQVCKHGRLWAFDVNDPWEAWRWHQCTRCDIVAIPYVTRFLDPTFWNGVFWEFVHWAKRDSRWLEARMNLKLWPVDWLSTLRMWLQLLYRWYSPKYRERLTMQRHRMRVTLEKAAP